MTNIDSHRIKEIRDNTAKMADAFTRIADAIERLVASTEQTEAKGEVRTAPSIDIVRCKECKYWNTSGCREGVGECEWAYYMTKPDDFCSYGERRE